MSDDELEGLLAEVEQFGRLREDESRALIAFAGNVRRNRDWAYRCIEDAELHYDVGAQAAAAGLPVDWAYVALRMAQALSGDHQRRPEVPGEDPDPWAPHLEAHAALYPEEDEP